MTIGYRAATNSGDTTYTVSAKTITLPAQSAAGDLVVVAVCIKPDTASDASMDQGFTLIRSATGGTGTQGADAGPTKINLFAKVLTGSEGTITLTPGASTGSWCQITHAFTTTTSWQTSIAASSNDTATGSDTTAASPVTATTTPTTKPTAGNAIYYVAAVPTDAGTGAPSTASCSGTGLSGGTSTAGIGGFAQSSTGNDSGIIDAIWEGFTGTATNSLTPSITNPGATNNYGVIATLNLRETANTNVSITQASSTETAFAITKTRLYSLAQASDTETAQAVSIPQRPIAQATETDTGQTLTWSRLYPLAQPAEADTAHEVVPPGPPPEPQIILLDLAW